MTLTLLLHGLFWVAVAAAVGACAIWYCGSDKEP
jgi:hypothetical protein